jgi:hypothetical protein
LVGGFEVLTDGCATVGIPVHSMSKVTDWGFSGRYPLDFIRMCFRVSPSVLAGDKSREINGRRRLHGQPNSSCIMRMTLFVLEGGYAVAEIGINAVNVLQGFG